MEFTFITSNTGITIPSTTPPENSQVRLPEYTYFEFTEPVTSLKLTANSVNLNAVDGFGNPVQITSSLNTVSFPSTTLIGIDITPLTDFVINGDTKLKAVLSWGSGFNKQRAKLSYCPELISVPDYLPASVIDMSAMFYGCTSFNQDISSWDVSNVTNMDGTFNGCTNFNQDISSWDVSSVTIMHGMFGSCTNFNQDISSWNVSNVTSMYGMFHTCTSFNQDLSSWDVSNVTIMNSMFTNCTNFNQDISSWNVSNVTVMTFMFYNCTSFNQDLSSWDLTGKLIDQFDYNTPSWTLPKPIF